MLPSQTLQPIQPSSLDSGVSPKAPASMLNWLSGLIADAALTLGGGLYIPLRWSRAPQADRATIGIAAFYFLGGPLLGAWITHLAIPRSTAVPTAATGTVAPSASSLPSATAQPMKPLNKFSAKVVDVTDGDTVHVIGPDNATYAVRLAGIDAPERDQAFGAQSTQHLTSLISGKSLNLDCENERSYGRLICKILLPSGEDVDLDQIEAGMAWHYKQYQDEQSPEDRASYAAADCGAMKAKIRLWSDPHPVQPQDFRHGTQSPLLLDANGCRTSSEPTSGQVIGNARSHIFQWLGCPYYSEISPDNRVPFTSPQAAEAAGYRPAHNCP